MAAPPRPNEIPADRLSAGPDESEYFTLPHDPDEIEIVETDLDTGSADVGEAAEQSPDDDGFYANLAAILPDNLKDTLATDLIRLVDMDKESRAKRDEQYEEGIRRTGMGKDAPGGAEFEGASRAVHPMITEACIDFQSRVIKELWPPGGPVKPNILGVVTKAKTEKAARVTAHMNHQITKEIKGARTTMEVLLAQVPLGGSQYIRQRWDHSTKRPEWQFASVDKVLLPANAADFASAKRKTFIDTVDKVEFQRRVASGMYLDLDLPSPAMQPDLTKTQQASHKVEGVSEPAENLDGDRDLYEIMSWLEVSDAMADALCACEGAPEEAGALYPYLITVDQSSKKVLSLYRAWEDGDETHEPIEHMFEFPFIPWRGAYAIGFPQIIGGLSAAATGALRGLLDSAHVNNIPSAVMLKGSGTSGQTKMPNPGEIVELDGGTEAGDIKKTLMAMPFNPPSPVLFQLLGFLVDAAKGVVRTSLDEQPMNSAPNTPVGTQISRVEEGMVVFSAIHGRSHAALNRLLSGLHRLNRLYLPEEIKVDTVGSEILVRRIDYEGCCDVEPVSDPTIYSDLQRFNQLNYIQQRMLTVPHLYKEYEVELAGLKLVKWPDPETLLHQVPEAHEMNAANENMAMVLAQPVAAFPAQNHLAHLQVHLDFMKSPVLGMNPMIGATFLAPALKHCVEHIAYLYGQHVEEIVSQAAKGEHADLSGDDPRVRDGFDKLLALSSQVAVPQIEASMKDVLPVLMKAAEALKALTPPPPIDPSQAAIEVAKGETARKAADDQATHQLSAAELEAKKDADDRKLGIQAAGVNAKIEGDKLRAATDLQSTIIDSNTAIQISESRALSGAPSHYTNGNSLTR